MSNFSDIGLNFPLFEAPMEEAVIEGPGECSSCGRSARFLFEKACYRCFRSGRADHTIDTEHGMVRPEDAQRGMTHGIPFNPENLPNLELVPHPVDPNFPDQHWYSVKYDVEDLRELTRTPAYHTWQGERWLFCCGRPGIYVGLLNQKRLVELATEARVTEEQLLARLLSCNVNEVRGMPRAIGATSVSVYLFRCQQCSALRAHYEMD